MGSEMCIRDRYYIQPIGTKVAASLSVSTSAVGILTMLTPIRLCVRVTVFSSFRGRGGSSKIDHSNGSVICRLSVGRFFCAFVYVICMRFFLDWVTFNRTTDHHSLWCGISGTKSKREGHGYIA